MKKEVAAWAGAVIDTDGYVGVIGKGTKSVHHNISVTNQNLEIMSALLRHFGGKVCFQRKGVKGIIWSWYMNRKELVREMAESISMYSTKSHKYLAEYWNC